MDKTELLQEIISIDSKILDEEEKGRAKRATARRHMEKASALTDKREEFVIENQVDLESLAKYKIGEALIIGKHEYTIGIPCRFRDDGAIYKVRKRMFNGSIAGEEELFIPNSHVNAECPELSEMQQKVHDLALEHGVTPAELTEALGVNVRVGVYLRKQPGAFNSRKSVLTSLSSVSKEVKGAEFIETVKTIMSIQTKRKGQDGRPS